MLLLFGRGHRPDIAVLREVAAATDRLEVTSVLDGDGPAGVELLRDGMTFDLLGAAPGAAEAVTALPHRIGVARDFEERETEPLSLQPGPHLAAGGRSVPVVRPMMGLAAMLVPHLEGLAALAWRPAGTLIGPDFFVSSMTAWLAGGAFPALGLTAFTPEPDGGLRSEGLTFFTGQELQIEPALAADRAAGARLGIRLVHQLTGQGRISAVEAITGPDGERLTLEPTNDGRVVRVRRR